MTTGAGTLRSDFTDKEARSFKPLRRSNTSWAFLYRHNRDHADALLKVRSISAGLHCRFLKEVKNRGTSQLSLRISTYSLSG
jgi:hypothetical protein